MFLVYGCIVPAGRDSMTTFSKEKLGGAAKRRSPALALTVRIELPAVVAVLPRRGVAVGVELPPVVTLCRGNGRRPPVRERLDDGLPEPSQGEDRLSRPD
jgi:hypothetical protein